MKLTKREYFALEALKMIIGKTHTQVGFATDEDYRDEVDGRVLGAIDYADTLIKSLKKK